MCVYNRPPDDLIPKMLALMGEGAPQAASSPFV
jgi:hypothetical protein